MPALTLSPFRPAPARAARLGCSLLLSLLSWPWAAGAQPLLPWTPKPDPAAWVEKIRQAGQQRNYSGTLVFTAAEVVSSSRVARFVVGDQVYERVDAMDGPQQRSYRHNEWVHTIWPSERVVTVERRQAADEPAGLPQIEARVQNHYDVRLLGSERVAGRDAHVLVLKPKDDARFTQRLWADQATGLLLRVDVLASNGQVLESTSFSNVEVDARVSRDQMLNPARRLEGYRTIQLPTESTSLDAEGWTLERLPAGFRMVGCVQRPVGRPTAENADRVPRALQAVYSDGLARVSVFIEAADPSWQRTPLMTHLGATHTLMRPREGRWWITVMGDVPAGTLKSFADALARKP